MNEPERSELERLKERQARLAQEFALLSAHLKSLEERLNQPQPAAAGQAALLKERLPGAPKPATKPTAAPPIAIPPIIRPEPVVQQVRIPTPPPPPAKAPVAKQVEASEAPPPAAAAVPSLRLRSEPDEKDFLKGTCEICNGHLEFPVNAAGETICCPHCGRSTILAVAAQPGAAPPPIARPIPAAPAQPLRASPLPPVPAAKGSFEMRLGTYWLVRIGVVIVLTALVFFGNLAYHNFISKLGPGGKVALLYIASAGLLAAGVWWQRKAAEKSLKNYAQVLFAGGLAAVYFTTYAAHHVPQLMIIPSPGLDGTLLLAWAGFMVWVADRKKSEVLALFAVGLAYYTSIITRVGYFTLYSNLVLTAAAVFFLVRNRWATLTLGSLVATYTAYAFWRFFNGGEWHWASPEQGLWTGTWFLISYWLLFTAAVFLSKDEKFSGQNRAGFLTLNNGAFFTGFVLTMLQVQTGGFWKFSLIYGAGLLVLAVLARLVLPAEPLTRNAYLTQGLLLVTVGFISKFSGLQLALILATESVILLIVSQQRQNLVLRVGACIAAALAVGWGIDGLRQFETQSLWLGAGLGALMMVNAVLSHRHGAETERARLRLQPSYFTTLALVSWFAATWNDAARVHCPMWLAAEAVVLIMSIYLLRVPEVSVLGQGYLFLAQLIWVYDSFAGSLTLPAWNPVAMMLIAMGLSYWWRWQKSLDLNAQLNADFDARVLVALPTVGKNLILFAAMHVGVKLAGGWDLGQPGSLGTLGICLPMGLGALMLGDALLAHRQTDRPVIGGTFRLQPAYSTALALVVWLAVIWHGTTREQFPLVLAVGALLLTFSFYLLRVPEIPVLGQGYAILAQAAWVVYYAFSPDKLPPWWNPILLMAITLMLSHWWQRQKFPELGAQIGTFCQGLYALAIVGVLWSWLAPKTGLPAWLAITSLLAVAVTAYGVFTRAWLLAVCGQIFMLISGVQFVLQLSQQKPDWPLALVPMAALGIFSYGTMRWFQQKPDPTNRVSQPLLHIAMLYRWVALVMSLWWVWAYIAARERIWLLALIGLWAFLWAGLRRSREALLFSVPYTVAALVLFWHPLLQAPRAYWPNLLVLVVLLAQRQVARRLPDRYPLPAGVHTAVIVIGGVSIWRFVSLWVLQQQPEGFYLTASWSLLALAFFTVGIALRERMYRWLGLGLLACALGRVAVSDVWRLQALYRVLSLLALGIVLLVLGFIYNKYQEKLKEWL